MRDMVEVTVTFSIGVEASTANGGSVDYDLPRIHAQSGERSVSCTTMAMSVVIAEA